ncbi:MULTISPECIES: flagellar hook-length control protein FliK [unclassified Ruegeria]|uniref:flagellar hook-length control protein FliK n=1 Tax=unclassified Ruegeria TaxID=2625375 RepID=UPI00148799E3|nr:MULTISPECIES: flagellar hook-length control protein FliK [unclassified Ruegeria]
MPNPLLTAIAPSNANAKSGGSSTDMPEQKAERSFEAVLEEQIIQQAEDAHPAEDPVPETGGDSSETVEDGEPMDATPNIVAIPDVASRQVSLAEPKGEVQGNNLAVWASSDHSNDSVSDQQNGVEIASGGFFKGHPDVSADDPVTEVQPVRTESLARNAPASAEGRLLHSARFGMQPTPDQARPAPAELPKTDAVPSPETADGTPQVKAPSAPDKAQQFVQMQLMAKQDTQAEAEVPDMEAPQQLRDNSPLQTTREPTSAVHALGANVRAEVARAIAGQMAAVIHTRRQAGAIEIALNPEELGRVSIVLNGRDDGVHLTIAAERPETLDIMRRHISVLEAGFRALGFGDLSFDLGYSSDAQQNGQDDMAQSPFEPEREAPSPSNTQVPSRVGASGRIDIRL